MTLNQLFKTRLRFAAVVFASFLAASIASGGHAAAASDPYPIAVLRALDKVTARVWTLEVPVNESIFFAELEIIARTCQKTPPEEVPESAAFLEIYESIDGDTIETVFSGWMFASSPGLSAMEHRVYDVWVIDCRSKSSISAAEASPSDNPSPEAEQSGASSVDESSPAPR